MRLEVNARVGRKEKGSDSAFVVFYKGYGIICKISI